MSEHARKLGHVVSVAGSKITAVLTTGIAAPVNGDSQSVPAEGSPQFGGLVKIPTPKAAVFGIITTMSITDPSSPLPHASGLMMIELIGEVLSDCGSSDRASFRRGVCVYPTLGAEVFAASDGDLAVVYARPDTACAPIGTISQANAIVAYALTDGLLGKHFAVLGTTGTGKSCSVALILRSILDRHPNGHLVLLDPHNEYADAFGSRAERISPENLQLPYWLMNCDEMVSTFVSRDSPERETEITILKQAVLEARRSFVGDDDDASDVTVDTPVPYRLGDVERTINARMGRMNKAEGTLPYLRLLARIEALRSDRRFEFMFAGLVVKDSMADVLSRILRIPVRDKPITIFDLSGVPAEIVDVVVSLLCRLIFDFSLWSVRAKAVPVLLVCEEAHRYIPQDERLGFALSRRALARIAKEGRKYGVALCLVSQRPAELSATILSQCNTVFALRLANEQDQDFVRRILPDAAHGLLAALPALHNREAIAVGEGVSLPMRLRFDELDVAFRPKSSTAVFSDAWQANVEGRAFLERTIDRWRHQRRQGAAVEP
jgi:hypothetical protein